MLLLLAYDRMTGFRSRAVDHKGAVEPDTSARGMRGAIKTWFC